jgi:hypothetical protein
MFPDGAMFFDGWELFRGWIVLSSHRGGNPMLPDESGGKNVVNDWSGLG